MTSNMGNRAHTDKKIWLVFGETGEYSDSRLWQVRAFDTEDEAKAFRDKCEAAYKAGQASAGERASWRNTTTPDGWKHPLDDDFEEDSLTGTAYAVSWVDYGWPLGVPRK